MSCVYNELEGFRGIRIWWGRLYIIPFILRLRFFVIRLGGELYG